jgi:hypothetical protein
MSQLRNDLRKQIYRKLMQWNRDAFELYDMAELPDADALEDAYTSLLNLVVYASPAMGLDADKLCYVIRKAFEEREAMQSH